MKKNEEYLDPDIAADLEAIANDEKYNNIPVPSHTKIDIFAKIAEYEQAEADGDSGKINEIRASVGMEAKEDNYSSLSEEDQQALKLGKELLRMQREQGERDANADELMDEEECSEVGEKKVVKIRRFSKKKKVLLLVAVMIALLAGMGIVGVGDDMRWLVSEEKEFESDAGVVVDSDVDGRLPVTENDEKAAYDLADEVIGVPVIRMVTEENIVYDSVEVMEEINTIYICYIYEDAILKYGMVVNKNKLSHMEMKEGELKEEYMIENSGVEITVQLYEDMGREVYYAMYTYNNVYYSLMAPIEQEKMEEILNNLHFY